jgi:hypothetical protein
MDMETLDKISYAKIPNKYKKQELAANHRRLEDLELNYIWEVVTTVVLHGPGNTFMACVKQRYCKYGFTIPYVSVIEMSENGYPIYCR